MIESHFVVSLASNFTATLLSQLSSSGLSFPDLGIKGLSHLAQFILDNFVKSLIAVEKH